jgi:hypothetical protein
MEAELRTALSLGFSDSRLEEIWVVNLEARIAEVIQNLKQLLPSQSVRFIPHPVEQYAPLDTCAP